jgi:hypothetical protein
MKTDDIKKVQTKQHAAHPTLKSDSILIFLYLAESFCLQEIAFSKET